MGHSGQDEITTVQCWKVMKDLATVVRQIFSMHIVITELKMGLGQVHAHSVAT